MGQQYCLDLKDILSDNAARTAAQILIESIVEDNVLKKQIGKDFLNKCLRNIQDDKAPAELRFYTLTIFKYFDSKDKTVLKIFSLLSSHPLFNYLTETAKKVDPRKSVAQKGKSLFPDNKQLGVKFMRLLLESLKLWGQRFPTNSNKQPTKYKKAVMKLMQQKVTFPESSIFYDGKQQKKQKQTPGDPNKSSKQRQKQRQREKVQVNTQKGLQSGQNGGSGVDERQIKVEVTLLYNKIQNYIGFIQDSQDPNELQRQIKKNHQMLQKQQKKLQASNIFSIQDESVLALYLKINEFIILQKNTYEQWILTNDDLKTYCDNLLLQSDAIFQEQPQNRQSEKPNKGKNQTLQNKQNSTIRNEDKKQSKAEKQQSKAEKQQSKAEKQQSKAEKQQSKVGYNSTASRNEDKIQKGLPKRSNQSDQDESPKGNRQRMPNKQRQQINDKGLRRFFDSHLQKPANKSLSGFKAIKESIQKEKSQLKVNPGRGRTPGGSGSLSKSKFNASTISKANNSSIFSKPPNPNVKSKKYQGAMVNFSPQLQGILYEMKKDQGMRRFKVSHLKNRALLFENGHIQIGYKSQTLYDQHQVKEYEEMIRFQLFIGNKSNSEIRGLEVVFQGDQRSLVYSNPPKVQQTIAPGNQVELDVVVIPRHQIYSLINMVFSYKVSGQSVQTSCIIPSSILKFSTYQRKDTRQIQDYENKCIKCYQSQKFLLSHYFPPKKLAHYIEELNQMSLYSDFAVNGSEKDFVLAAFVNIKDKYKGQLKVNIRPNLSVVLQFMSDDDRQQAQKQFKLYVQTLSMILKQAR